MQGGSIEKWQAGELQEEWFDIVKFRELVEPLMQITAFSVLDSRSHPLLVESSRW